MGLFLWALDVRDSILVVLAGRGLSCDGLGAHVLGG